MAAQIIQLLPFQNVVASGTAVCDLSNLFGYGIERITLLLGGTFTKAMMTSIQLKANGKVIVDTDGTKCDTRMQWRGISASSTALTIDFLEIKNMRTKAGLLAGVLDTTIGIKSLRLEVTISGATSPTLAGFAEVEPPSMDAQMQNVRPLIARVHRLTQSIAAAGTFPMAIPHLDPLAGGSLFKRIAFFSANMTGARVERNGIREWELTTVASMNFNAGEYGRTSQSNFFCVDFILDGLQEDRILDTRPANNTTTAAVYGTFSGAETITIEAEVLEPLDVY